MASPKKGNIVQGVACAWRSSSLLKRKLPATDRGAELLQLPFRYIAWGDSQETGTWYEANGCVLLYLEDFLWEHSQVANPENISSELRMYK